MFVNTGDVGAPWGKTPFKQAICAIVIAASSPNEYGFDFRRPAILPK